MRTIESDIPEGTPFTMFWGYSEHKNEEVFDDTLIRDPKGKLILFEGRLLKYQARKCAEALSHLLGREIGPVEFRIPVQGRGGYDTSDVAALCPYPFHPHVSLTMIERAKVAIMAEYYRTYRPGLRNDIPVLLPKVLLDLEDESFAQEPLFGFRDERTAWQLADIVQRLFYQQCEVIDSPHGWLVSVAPEDIDAMTASDMAKLIGICRLLDNYDVTPHVDTEDRDDGGDYDRAVHAELREKQHRQRNSLQAQLDEITAILREMRNESRTVMA